jgi:hypothetical protein
VRHVIGHDAEHSSCQRSRKSTGLKSFAQRQIAVEGFSEKC